MASLTKTLELKIHGLLSTRYTKSELINAKTALVLEEITFSEPLLTASETKEIQDVKKFVLLATEGDSIYVELTKNGDTLRLKLNQLLYLGDAFDLVHVINEGAVGSAPQRVRCIWC